MARFVSDTYEAVIKEVTSLQYDGKYEKGLKRIDSALSQKNIDETTRIKLFILKISVLCNMGIYHGVILIADELIDRISIINLPIEFIEAHIYKINSLQRTNKGDESLEIIKEMQDFLAKHKEIPNRESLRLQSELLYYKGNINWQKGKTSIANEYLQEAVKLIKDSDEKELLGRIYNRIGTVYYSKGDLNEALVYFKRNFNIQIGLMNKRQISVAYNNFGIIFAARGEYELALECYKNCLNIDIELNNESDTIVEYNNIGILHFRRGDFDKALESFKMVHSVRKEALDDFSLGFNLFYTIRILLEMKSPKEELQTVLFQLKDLFEKSKTSVIKGFYYVSKGLIQKSSTRLSEKIEAQQIFREVITEDSSSATYYLDVAILNLIEILLLEFKSTEEKVVFQEIEELTQKLLNRVKKQSVYPTLVKLYLLQSKLSLINFDIEKAKELLEEAGKLTAEKSLRNLSIEVMKEQKKLKYKISALDTLKTKKPSLRERVELTQIEDTLLKMHSHQEENLNDVETLNEEFNIEKLSLLVFRFGTLGAEFFKGIVLPESENLDRDLIYMSSMFMTVLGQGSEYHTGLFGPLPVPIADHSALIYSLVMKDREQKDERLKGETFSLFCILYPQYFSTLFYNRDNITQIFENYLNREKDINDIDEESLKALRVSIYKKVTEIFTPTPLIESLESIDSQ